MAFLSDLFDSVTNQQATPQQTIIPTQELLKRGYDTATGMAPEVASLNKAYQPIITGNQLSSENQVFGPSANQLQKGTMQSFLDELNLGGSVSPELQDLITTNTLQQLGRSGVGSTDIGKLFGARSLLSAGLDLKRQRQQDALRAIGVLPSTSMSVPTLGIPDPMAISNAISGEQAAKDRMANVQEQVRRSNFSNLINTGGRIIGMVAGGVLTGGSPMGIQAGGAIGGSLGGHTGVYGMDQGGSKGGGGGGSGFTSILSGLFNNKGSSGMGGTEIAGGEDPYEFGGGGFGNVGYA